MFAWLKSFFRTKPKVAAPSPKPFAGKSTDLVWYRTAEDVGRDDLPGGYPALVSSEVREGWRCATRLAYEEIRHKLRQGKTP